MTGGAKRLGRAVAMRLDDGRGRCDSMQLLSRRARGEVIYEKNTGGKLTHFILRTPAGDLIAEKRNDLPHFDTTS